MVGAVVAIGAWTRGGVDAQGVGSRAATAALLLDLVHAESGVPAAGAAVVRDGVTLWAGGAGFADRDGAVPVEPHHRFRLASVSKLFTAAAAMSLHAEGRLPLDEPVARWVPEWSQHEHPPITARQLAAHTAGLNHYRTWQTHAHDALRHHQTATESVFLFADAPLLFAPGTEYSYSSFGYVLLAAAVEGADGRPFPEVLRSRLLEPVGLAEVAVEHLAQPHPHEVVQWRLGDDGPFAIQRESESAFMGATAIVGSPRGVAQFASAFLSNRIVEAPLVEESFQPMHLSDGRTIRVDERYGIGFGWRIGNDWDGRPVVHHAGLTPGARAVAVGYPDDGAAVALLTNATWTSRIETTAELIAAPFLEARFPGVERCPTGAWELEGEFRERPTRAELVLAPDEDTCSGTLHATGALADQFGGPREFRLVRIGVRGPRHVYALVYPWGLARVEVGSLESGGRLSGDIVGWPLEMRAERPRGLLGTTSVSRILESGS